MTEAEAQAIRFTVDHYEPQTARADLANDYSNLMYACDPCNQRKGNRCPPPVARADGYRFFRPDEDLFDEHFEPSGIRLSAKTNAGAYSIQALDLNRLTLRKIRDLRERLTKCDKLVAEGVRALKKFRIDQLPPNIRGAALRATAQAEEVAEKLGGEIDKLLRDYAKSELIDPEPKSEAEQHKQERNAALTSMHALYPGTWRAERQK